ncbi:MAG TPA: fibronectin type III domain-containing protein [Tepidisphaeraceae bacterium]|jgi:hypothetical protein|nr:fibronectin type III domain-containing protein [Tepidisphaeraceae bacterium]
MRVVPEKQAERIEFYRLRLAVWQEHAEALGLSDGELADLTVAVEATKVAYQAAQAARTAAQMATQRLATADEAMARMGAAAVSKIRGAARLGGDHVYGMAHLPAPAQASPIAPPGTPERFTVTLTVLGWVELSWQCKQPRGAAGTMYQVYRSLGDGAPSQFIGTAGKRKFVDTTVPAGTPSMMYRVRAVRSRAVGSWAQFNVHFGTDGPMPKTIIPTRAVSQWAA